MKVFNSILKMNIKQQLQYRSAAFSGMLTQLFFGLMQIALYTQFLTGNEDGFTISQMASYIWLQQILYTLLHYFDNSRQEISTKIESGDVVYQLIRPMKLYNYWYANTFSRSMGMVLVRGIPLLLIVFWFPANMGLSLPASWAAFALFVVSLCISAFLVSAIRMYSYIISLYTLNSKAVFSFTVAVSAFLAGQVVPIPLMPNVVEKIFSFFPFRYVADLPFRIYVGNISGNAALIQIAIQVAWLVGLVLVGKLIMKKKVNNLVVQGG